VSGRKHGGGGASQAPGKESLRPPPPRRFYKQASAVLTPEGAFAVALDGRMVRTPGKRALAMASQPLASAIAAEWAAQGERIDPETMPLTRLINAAIDAVAGRERDVAADIAAFGARDLLCYRAGDPRALTRLQAESWDPLLRWAETALGARLAVAEGVMPIEQSAAARRAILDALAGFTAFDLAALHVMTTLTGSAVLALAAAKGRLTARQAWDASHVDEDWQISRWGGDAEAALRRARRWIEMEAAARFLGLARKGDDG